MHSKINTSDCLFSKQKLHPKSAQHRHHHYCVQCTSQTNNFTQPERQSLEVSSVVVKPVFRTKFSPSSPQQDLSHTALNIAFVSESGICRGPIALAAFQQALASSSSPHLSTTLLTAAAFSTQDYVLDQPPHPTTFSAASSLSLPLPQEYKVQLFQPEIHADQYDIILTMDEFTLADVLREVSVLDLVSCSTQYCQKVRRLGEWNEDLIEARKKAALRAGVRGTESYYDIEDGLYSNIGGDQEMDKVMYAGQLIVGACRGLVAFLEEQMDGIVVVESKEEITSLREVVKVKLAAMEDVDWMKPPMLSPKGW
jgi:protein-tyrosine-phosphatase